MSDPSTGVGTPPVPKDVLALNVSAAARKKALDDGLLVDAGTVAWDAGFSPPTSITKRVWSDCVAWTAEDDARQLRQDQQEQLWNLLFMAYVGVRTQPRARASVLFRVACVPRDGRSTEAQRLQLKIVLSKADDGARLLTILYPDED